jgi:glutamate mutase epsilon subunit
MAVRIADTVRNTRIDSIRAAIDAGAGNGLLRIYAGSKPGTKGGTPAGALLAELTCAKPCGTSSGGVLTFSVPFSDTSANNTGTAAFFYLTDSTGAYVAEGDCAVSASDLNLTTTSIVATQPVQVTSLTITDGNA